MRRIYNSTNTEDLDLVVRHIETRFPASPKFAVGCSLGGMLLFNYLSVECRGLTVGVDASPSSGALSPTSAVASASAASSNENAAPEEETDEEVTTVVKEKGMVS